VEGVVKPQIFNYSVDNATEVNPIVVFVRFTTEGLEITVVREKQLNRNLLNQLSLLNVWGLLEKVWGVKTRPETKMGGVTYINNIHYGKLPIFNWYSFWGGYCLWITKRE